MATPNEKRSLSCKAVGGVKKRTGHAREFEFNTKFDVPERPITYKAESDTVVTKPEYTSIIGSFFGVESFATSVKSGKNLQFILGRVPEVVTGNVDLSVFSDPEFWWKYLGKSKSARPADILAYWSEDNWTFFKMKDIIDFICSQFTWRLLATGRIKGDCKGTQYLTYEVRPKKGQFVGANGNKGEPFIHLLQKYIPVLKIDK